jgi:peptidoglycan/LPS O-acetylase OafA/YrhL
MTKFTLVQSLRGLAALWVVLFHLRGGGHIESLVKVIPSWIDRALFQAGHLGVPVFFAISGFVIAHSLSGKTVSSRFLGVFLTKRLVRLAIPYWVSIALMIAYALLSAWIKHEPYTVPSAGDIALHATYLQEIAGVDPISVVYWTLTYEVQFYCVLAGLFLAIHYGVKALDMRAAVTVHCLMYALAIIWGLGLAASPPGLFVNLWFAFYIGALAYWAGQGRANLFWLLLLAGLLAIFNDSFAITAALVAVALCYALRTGAIRHALSQRPVQWVGTISYSLYLLHLPLQGASAFLLKSLVGSSVGADILVMVLTTAAAVLGAGVFHHVVEAPAHRLANRLGDALASIGQGRRTVAESI